MFVRNSLAFSMIQRMLAIWSQVLLPFLNRSCMSGSSQFTYWWSLAWRILSITLLACDESESCFIMSDSLWPHGLYSPWNSPGSNTGVDSCSLLQGILPTQGLNPGLPRCRWILYQLTREQLRTPVFWPGEFYGLYSPLGHRESDMTEQISVHLMLADDIVQDSIDSLNFF